MWNDENLTKVLKEGGIAVMPTDTLYGIVGSALNISVVNRIYEARKRAPNKPCIILIGEIGELEKFSITLSKEQKNIIKEFKEPVSFILDCLDEKFSYLHRGTKTLAFRLPAQAGLQELLKETGPLVAPSANLEGLSPAQNIAEAKKYFGDKVDLYVDGGEIQGKASRIIKLNKDGSVEILR
ncbi:threonylcarbamoyl-AMP synthase [Candidatus Nomurabacteria bacterium RIFCSPHIGHO2_01_FULL_42_15]|uniref:L-threonylcarbamoyladenylate synthase n=1 Tax=Candidatus Nomurabacteria bacterium RIFCSPHIGHO2_01_FULL_42_15 TaxID=1801742 RepID=A0A1F6VDZ1_9BACT|nr:MAG: threonylcarbamoyl-AMP synthase [Candidatus Nomurabacteria bacterium RIFCSPHIGHO2_01_FULL_42_15]OGI93240.1 MAG: threonylcarbamoyl-AMP synthase [Candidatus Nomurabacteria bacterium RIFCSPLOWO2_01_FULL_41_18]